MKLGGGCYVRGGLDREVRLLWLRCYPGLLPPACCAGYVIPKLRVLGSGLCWTPDIDNKIHVLGCLLIISGPQMINIKIIYSSNYNSSMKERWAFWEEDRHGGFAEAEFTKAVKFKDLCMLETYPLKRV